ncbi:MAG: class I SAM-dependent methyltransferase [Armatimonadota bacterium]
MARSLLRKGATTVADAEPPVVDFVMPEYVPGETDMLQWIEMGIRGFREWYQPVDFGHGHVAHVTTPPDWEPSPELDEVRGLAKWEHIVKRHIPNVTGKRVLDLGCNNGVFSIELARMGAREVIGIDRNRDIRQESSPQLPVQDVVAQAEFVKRAFEIRDGVTYPIRYIAANIARIGELELGRFDLILALCVAYHQLDATPALLQVLSEMTDHIVLQTTLLHGGELAHWASPYVQAELLMNAGYRHVEIDAPACYAWPVIVGRR